MSIIDISFFQRNGSKILPSRHWPKKTFINIQWNWRQLPAMNCWDLLSILNSVPSSTNSQSHGRSEIQPRLEALDLDSQASNLDVIQLPATRTHVQNSLIDSTVYSQGLPILRLLQSCPKIVEKELENLWPKCRPVCVTLCSKEFLLFSQMFVVTICRGQWPIHESIANEATHELGGYHD